MRQKLIWGAIIVGAMFYIVAFIIGDQTPTGKQLGLEEIRKGISMSISVVATMAIGLGIVNLFTAHGAAIWKRKKEWPFSVIVFLVFFLVLGALVWQARINAQTPSLAGSTADAVTKYRDACEVKDADARDAALAVLTPQEIGLVDTYYASEATYRFMPRNFVYNYVLFPLGASVMALLGFYITYAAYRAFRIRSLEATVMMISATVVIIGSDMIGGLLSAKLAEWSGSATTPQWMSLPWWADFFNRVINSGMQRGLLMGIGVATIAAALRTLLGFERALTEIRQGGE